MNHDDSQQSKYKQKLRMELARSEVVKRPATFQQRLNVAICNTLVPGYHKTVACLESKSVIYRTFMKTVAVAFSALIIA